MSDRHRVVVRNSFIATGAVAALILFLLFYSTVTGAVERAARHRNSVALSQATPAAVAPGRALAVLTASAR